MWKLRCFLTGCLQECFCFFNHCLISVHVSMSSLCFEYWLLIIPAALWISSVLLACCFMANQQKNISCIYIQGIGDGMGLMSLPSVQRASTVPETGADPHLRHNIHTRKGFCSEDQKGSYCILYAAAEAEHGVFCCSLCFSIPHCVCLLPFYRLF